MKQEENVYGKDARTGQAAEAEEKEGPAVLGKFKTVNALAEAYSALQAEFTRRSQRLKELEKMQEDGVFEVLPKKEVAKLMHEMEKLEKNLGGIKNMKKVPDMMFVVDTRKERIAVQEAHTLGIPIVAIVDTNCAMRLTMLSPAMMTQSAPLS